MTTFTGTNGDNTLPSIGANNTGDDIFQPLLGHDVVDGGEGNDLLVIDYSSNTFTGGGGFSAGLVTGLNDDGSGSYSGYFYAYKDTTGSYDRVDFSNIERFQVTGTNQSENLRGGQGNDTLNGGGGSDTVFAVDGIDQVDGGTGTDTLEFANLSDATNNLVIDGLGTLFTASNGTNIKNIEQFRNLWTGSGNDSITFTTRYDEIIRTGNGNDSINAGLGKDNIDGQGGSDTLIINYSSNAYAGTLAHSAGISSYFYSNNAGGWNGSLSAYYADADNSYDRVDFSNIERFQITGTSAGDFLSFGGYNSFSIDGGGGTDTIDRADFRVETAALTIDNSGAAIAQNNGTTVKNVERFNNLWTGSGNDVIALALTERYNKSIYAGAGNDSINSGLGQNYVDGQNGSDILTINYTSNLYAGTLAHVAGITSSYGNNGAGGWTGYLYAYYADVDNNYDQVRFDNIEKLNIVGTGFGDAFSYGGYRSIGIDGGLGIDTIDRADFSAENAALTISNSGAAITQGNGTVVKNVERFNNLWTGAVNDTIDFSVRYNENINSGAGDDTINPGLGLDYVDGGTGNDLLIINYASNTYAGGSIAPGLNGYINSNSSGGWNGSLFANYADLPGSYDQVNFSNIERFQITGTGAGDFFNYGGYSNFAIDGSAGIDSIDRANFSTELTDLSIDNSGQIITQGNGTIVKNVERFNNLWTGSGNDTITLSERYDKSIYSGFGSDTINAGLGRNYIDGGAGSDLLTIDYSSNTYAGTLSHVAGVNGSFANNGLGGWNGTLYAYYADTDGSYDRSEFYNIEKLNIIGTSANEVFSYGGYGSICINGGTGTDTIDRADFSAETVALSLNSTGGTITQSNGTVVKNVERFNNLWTGSGNDTITFSVRYNEYTINTGDGDDTINSGLGIDNVDGDTGNDLLIVNYASNAYAGAGAGINSSLNSNGYGGWNGNLSANYANVPGSYDQVSFSNIERFQITGTGQNDNIFTGSGNDTITSGAGNDSIHSGGGIDVIDGGLGTDTLVDTNFSDVLTNLTINNGSATQTLSNGFKITSVEQYTNLITGSGNDNISFTGRYNDQVNTGIGNDTINLGLGQDRVDGDFGNDLLIVDYSSNTYAGNATFAAGITFNSFYYQGFSGSWSGLLRANTDTLGNFDQVDFTNIERFQLTGTINNDLLNGGGGNDVLNGNSGNDTINAGAGNDTVNGGAGNDSLNGGNGTDLISYLSATGSVTVNLVTGTASDGQGGTDTLSGFEYVYGSNTAGDNLTGDAGNNYLYGYGGNDTLNGGDGNDTLLGGAGNNVLNGGVGIDTAYYYSATIGVIANLATGITSNNGQGGTDTLIGIEYLIGSNTAGDNLTGDSGANALYGYGGNDTLTGGMGNDTLSLGVDTVTDNVNYTSGDGTDTVLNFVRGGGGDRLNFIGISNIDVFVSGTNTQFRVGDATVGNVGFGTGTLLLTTSATTGFLAADVNVNLLGATFAFS